MNFKLPVALAAIIILTMIGFFFINDSYKFSLQAKFFYATQEYEKALKLANKARELNAYNKMAQTIATQSQTSLQIQNFIKEAKNYLNEIGQLLIKNNRLKRNDLIKIKFMVDIVLGRYKKISPTVAIDDNLVKEFNNIYKRFVKLNETVAQKN